MDAQFYRFNNKGQVVGKLGPDGIIAALRIIQNKGKHERVKYEGEEYANFIYDPNKGVTFFSTGLQGEIRVINNLGQVLVLGDALTPQGHASYSGYYDINQGKVVKITSNLKGFMERTYPNYPFLNSLPKEWKRWRSRFQGTPTLPLLAINDRTEILGCHPDGKWAT